MGGAGDGACTAPASAGLGYRRREPERTLLHATVRAHLKTFLAEMEQRGDGVGLPGFVISEFRTVPRLRHPRPRLCPGPLLLVRQGDVDRLSCKGRGFCPSCTTRRMQGTATQLLDWVLPHVPMRQLVLSLPRWAHFLLARDPRLITRALDIALRAIFSLQRSCSRPHVTDGRGHLRSTIRRSHQTSELRAARRLPNCEKSRTKKMTSAITRTGDIRGASV